MRALVFCFGLTLASCTEIPTSGGGPAAGAAQRGAVQAYFTDYPTRLYALAEALCDGPGQSVVKPNRNQVRCESLPDPESAAALILQFDGTVEDLPRLVISFAGRDTPQGYLMTADNYVRVPQRNGGARQVRFFDEEVVETVTGILETAGGRPL